MTARKMKDSGIEWIGEIPEEWKLSKINNLYEIRNTKVSDKNYDPLSVTMKGIVPQIESAAKTNSHDDRKLVKKGDFVINSRSDRRGSCGISSYEGSVSLINTVIKPLSEMNPNYYNWFFHTEQFADEFFKWGHGIVNDLWTTTWNDMKRIVIVYPPLPEQKRIADFLDEKCSEIDDLTADIEEQIKTLEEYRKSVITEVVTKGLNPNVELKDSDIEWIGKIPKEWDIKKVKYLCKERNEKYKIIGETKVGDQSIVIAYNPKSPSPFVTWKTTPTRKRGFDIGHYYSRFKDAYEDYKKRCNEMMENHLDIQYRKIKPKNKEHIR